MEGAVTLHQEADWQAAAEEGGQAWAAPVLHLRKLETHGGMSFELLHISE